MLVALGLILWPVLGLTGALLHPQNTSGMEGEFAAIIARPGAWMVDGFLILLAFCLAGMAVVGLLFFLPQRGLALATVGALLMALGCYFHGAVEGFALTEVPLVLSGRGTAELLELSDFMYSHPAFVMLLIPFLGFFIGQVVLALGLWRGGVVRWWWPALMTAALVSEFVGPEATSPELMFVPLLLCYGWLGVKMIRGPLASVSAVPATPLPIADPLTP
jgi:hypothetical protein